MNWNFSAWSIRNPVPAILLFIVLVALGLMSFSKLPVTRFPNIDIPLVSVTVTDPGRRAERARNPDHQAHRGCRRQHLAASRTSPRTLTEGTSQTTVEFRLEVDTQTAVNDVKDAVERIHSDLPATADEPVVSAHRRRRAGDPHLCRLGAGHDDRGAVLVRRRHGHPQAAGLEGRRAASTATAA